MLNVEMAATAVTKLLKLEKFVILILVALSPAVRCRLPNCTEFEGESTK